MGMYDSVITNCPNCGMELEFQSKAGQCSLIRYIPEAVPAIVAADISEQGPQKCPKCGETVYLTSLGIPPYVCMVTQVLS